MLWWATAALAHPVAELERFQQAMFEELAPSVVFVQSKRGFGSGVVVDGNGLVLTNAHVVDGQDTVEVVAWDGRRLRGEVVEHASDEVDLALVELSENGLSPAKLGTAEALSVGSWVASIGHGSGGLWTFTTGMVSNSYAEQGERPMFQTQIPLNPGASGGPIVDSSGRVVGIVTSGIADSNAINFAIKIDVAYAKLERMDAYCPCLEIHAPRGVAVFLDGTMVGQGPEVRLPVADGEHEAMAVIGGQMVEVSMSWPQTRALTLEPPKAREEEPSP